VYLYAARVVKVVDGDTLDLDVDLGFGIWVHQRVRLASLNCPEHGTPEGEAATSYTRNWLAQHEPQLVLRTQKDAREKFGRYLGTVLDGTASLNADLLATGHAVPYDGRKPASSLVRG
jgi:micrococcal nuclease